MKLKHLQSLQLTSYPIEKSWWHLKLEPLSGLENLSQLELSGVIDNPSVIVNTKGLSQNLTRLTLVNFALRDDPMPVKCLVNQKMEGRKNEKSGRKRKN